MTLKELLKQIPDDSAAEQWFIEQRWPEGICCPDCGSLNIQTGCRHPNVPFRCREKVCSMQFFSVRTGTVMHRSKIRNQDWLIASFLVTTSLTGVSSMKLHRDLDITQKTAWFLAQRLRVSMFRDGGPFSRPVEVDETHMGGQRKSMPKSKREEMTGRGAVGKTAVVGAKHRASNKVTARVVTSTDKQTLQGFVEDHAGEGAAAHTDDAIAFESLNYDHDTVKHSLEEVESPRSRHIGLAGGD